MSSAEASSIEFNQSDRPLRILIVEDDPLIQLGLEQYLTEFTQNIVVGQAANGYIAIDLVRSLLPDLAIVDIGLPKLDGIAATQKIKLISPNTKVLVLTSHNTETEIIAALASGADAYCIKGTNMTGLLTAIAAAQQGAVYLDPQIARKAVGCLQPQTRKPDCHHASLSSRELEILELIVAGNSNPEIAQQLYLSLSTVKTHIRSIMNKLTVNDRVQAAVVALRSGLVE